VSTNTELNGPYTLSIREADRAVGQISAGTYALGRTDSNNVFHVAYVGCSGSDLNAELKAHVGQYGQFKYGYLGSLRAAFEKECHLYHDFNPPDNPVHPARGGWPCPRCNVLGSAVIFSSA
jgi:hypothetical protein